MYTKWFVAFFGIFVAILMLLTSSAGCSTKTEHVSTPTAGNNSELSVFILGEWLSTEANSEKSATINLGYKIVFETPSLVKFIVIYPDGGTEGYNFTYNFVDENSIFIDNKRITGGETWLLEKMNDDLIITRNFDNKTTIIRLERTK